MTGAHDSMQGSGWVRGAAVRILTRMLETTEQLLAFHSRLLLAIHGIREDDLRRPEADGAWSILEVIVHLSHVELLTALRLRMMAVEEEPQLPALPQNAWVARLGGESLADALEHFWSVRRQNVRLLRSLAPADIERTGVHPNFGRLTIAQLATRVRDHAEKHLGQIERIKTTLGLSASTASDLTGVTAGVAGTDHRSIGPGVRVFELWSDGLRRALQVELDAGAQWPGLDHHVPGPEEVFILSGDFDDGAKRYEAGTFLHHPAGTSHSPLSRGGCKLFVFYPEG